MAYLIFLSFVGIFLSVCKYMYVTSTHRCLRRPEDVRSLELKLLVVVSHSVSVLRIKPGGSTRTVGALSCWAICPALNLSLKSNFFVIIKVLLWNSIFKMLRISHGPLIPDKHQGQQKIESCLQWLIKGEMEKKFLWILMEGSF